MKEKIQAMLQGLKARFHCYCAIKQEFFVLSATEESMEKWILVLGCRSGENVFGTFEELEDHIAGLLLKK